MMTSTFSLAVVLHYHLQALPEGLPPLHQEEVGQEAALAARLGSARVAGGFLDAAAESLQLLGGRQQ